MNSMMQSWMPTILDGPPPPPPPPPLRSPPLSVFSSQGDIDERALPPDSVFRKLPALLSLPAMRSSGANKRTADSGSLRDYRPPVPENHASGTDGKWGSSNEFSGKDQDVEVHYTDQEEPQQGSDDSDNTNVDGDLELVFVGKQKHSASKNDAVPASSTVSEVGSVDVIDELDEYEELAMRQRLLLAMKNRVSSEPHTFRFLENGGKRGVLPRSVASPPGMTISISEFRVILKFHYYSIPLCISTNVSKVCFMSLKNDSYRYCLFFMYCRWNQSLHPRRRQPPSHQQGRVPNETRRTPL